MTKKVLRQRDVLKRLKEQLKSGVKPEKVNGKTTMETVPLSDGDKNRIKKDINILSNRISKYNI